MAEGGRWTGLTGPDRGGLGTRASQALMRKQITWTVCWTKCNFLPIQLEGPPSGISNKLPGGGNATGWRTSLEEQDSTHL